MKDKEKMMERAKGMDFAMKIAMILYLATSIFTIIYLAIIIGYAAPKVQEHKLTLDYATIEFVESVRPELENDNTILEYLMLMEFVAVPVVVYGLILFRRMLAPIKAGRPFDEAASLNIKKLSYLVFAFGAVSQVTRNVSRYIRFSESDLLTLIGPERVKSFTFEWDIDPTFFLIGALLYLIYCIFKYGEVLQRESDETL